VLLDALRQSLECRDYRVIGVSKIAAREHRRGVNRHGFDDDHGRSAERPLDVVCDMLIARETVFRHVGRVRTEHDSVSKAMTAKGNLGKDPRKLSSHLGNLKASDVEMRASPGEPAATGSPGSPPLQCGFDF
jgi:hypothetical protein